MRRSLRCMAQMEQRNRQWNRNQPRMSSKSKREPLFGGVDARFVSLLGFSARSLARDVEKFLDGGGREPYYQMSRGRRRQGSPSRNDASSGSLGVHIEPLGVATDRLSLPSKGSGVRWEVAVRPSDVSSVKSLSNLVFGTHMVSVVDSTEARFRRALEGMPFPCGTPGVILRFLPVTVSVSDISVFLEGFSLSRTVDRPIRIVHTSKPFARSTTTEDDPSIQGTLPPEATAVIALESDDEALRACIALQGKFFTGVAAISPGRVGSGNSAARAAHAAVQLAERAGISVALGSGLVEEGDVLHDIGPLQRWVQVELLP